MLTGPRVHPILVPDLGPGQRLCPRGAMRVAPASPSSAASSVERSVHAFTWGRSHYDSVA